MADTSDTEREGKSTCDLLYDGANGATEAGAPGALAATGGTHLALTLGAPCSGPLALLTDTATCSRHRCT